MKAHEVVEYLFSLADERDYSRSGDKCISGSPEAEVTKVAVCMFATPDLIKEAAAWGAELLIAHEPVFHSSAEEQDEVDVEKRKLIEDLGITVYRYHDHTHYTTPDIIAAGEFQQIGLEGTMETTEVFDLVRLHLKEAITPLTLAKLIEEKLGIKHVRICGDRNTPCKVLSGMFGAPGNAAFEELKAKHSEIVLVGETREWQLAEYARDAAQLGHKKSLLILGHEGSERDGMRYTADLVAEHFPELKVRYLESGEVYSYTEE